MIRFLGKLFVLMSYLSWPAFSQNLQLQSSLGSGFETGGKMVRDHNGNIYQFGTFTDTLKVGPGIIAVSAGNFDCYLIKFNRYLQPLWVKTIGSIGADGAGDLDYFDGKIFLGGWYGATLIISGDTMEYNPNCISPGFISCLDTSGNTIRSLSFTQPNSISCFINDLQANEHGLYIAGKIKGQFNFGNGLGIYTYLSGTEHNIFMVRFDTAFTCSMAMHANSSLGNQNGDDGASSVQVDSEGNIYLAGHFGSLPGLGNATLYLGGQTASAMGGYGFSDYFIAKIKPNGVASWLRTGGGSLPDYLAQICLDNDQRLVAAGRYSDNTDWAGISLPSSQAAYSTFIGVIDSAGTGLSAYRVSNESTFFALKKGDDDFMYAADINLTLPSSRFRMYKLHADSGIVAMDSVGIFQAGSYNYGDLITPDTACGELYINCSYQSRVFYHGDTVLAYPYLLHGYDFFYGKYHLNGSFPAQPLILNGAGSSICSDTSGVTISLAPQSGSLTYHWMAEPISAGTFSGNTGNVQFIPDAAFSGAVHIFCYSSDFCDISPVSDTLVLNILPSPVIYTLSDIGFGTLQVNLAQQTQFNWYYNNVLMPSGFNSFSVSCQGPGNYMVIAENGICTDTLSEFFNCITTDDFSETLPEQLLFPNPAANYILLNLPGKSGAQVKIFDLSGRTVLEQIFSAGTAVISLHELAGGCYVVSIENEERQHWLGRFIKN